MIELPLTNGKIITIDESDSDLLSFRWSALRNGNSFYAIRKVANKTIYLHRIVLSRILGRDLIAGEQCDHIDLNRLNNLRTNLRLCTVFENNQNKGKFKNNTSGYKGVSWHKASNKWQAKIKVRNEHIWLGCFDTPQEAHDVYCEAALKYHGEFARFQ